MRGEEMDLLLFGREGSKRIFSLSLAVSSSTRVHWKATRLQLMAFCALRLVGGGGPAMMSLCKTWHERKTRRRRK